MKTILLIVDEPEVLDFIKNNLLENGHSVYKSSNLNDALKYISPKHSIDLIVINSSENIEIVNQFVKKLKIIAHKTALIISRIEIDQNNIEKNINEVNKIIIKSTRPKTLLSLIKNVLNNEEVNWLPTYN